MKLSETKTDWMILKASTNSEWDSCDFVLVQLTPAYINTLKERSNLARSFLENTDLYSLVFWDGPKGWYRYAEENSESMEMFSDGVITWSFIEFEDDGERDAFVQPEQRIDIRQMEVYKDGEARFTGAGKYTDEDFWTSEFSIDALIPKNAI
jgi:hypothetical protein